jgi:hypothetical protein
LAIAFALLGLLLLAGGDEADETKGESSRLSQGELVGVVVRRRRPGVLGGDDDAGGLLSSPAILSL